MPAPKKAKAAPGQVLGTSKHPTWVWVEDQSTGHRYDVRREAVRLGMLPVPGYPEHVGPKPRPTKHFVGKDGRPARFEPRPDGPVPEPVDQLGDQAAGAVDQLADPPNYDPTDGRDPAPVETPGEPAEAAGVTGDAVAADSPASDEDSGPAEPATRKGKTR
jgi:hypothetical protein